ncbi:hypothetical protein ACFX15_027865 [Malus domestica]
MEEWIDYLEEWIDYLDYIDKTQPTDFFWSNGTPFGNFEFSALNVPAVAVPQPHGYWKKSVPQAVFPPFPVSLKPSEI